MPVKIPRTSRWYMAGGTLAISVALAVSAVAIQKYSNVWKFMLHPVCNSIGLGLMGLGILEQGNESRNHVILMSLAGLFFFLGWLFMYLQHAEKGASHFAKDSPWWHQVHVYLGYSLLICWLIQIAGGVLKYTSLPKRGVVKWHGILAQVMFALKQPQFIIAAVMSLWTGSQVHPDSGHYSEVLFSFLFIGMYAAVMGAFYYAGERIYGDADQDETGSLNSKTGAADSDAGERDAEGRPILSSPIGGGGGSTSSPGRI